MSIKSCYFFLNVVIIYMDVVSIAVTDKGILPLVKNSIGIRFYVDVTNENRQSMCDLLATTKKCCLIDTKKEDCNVMAVYGESMETVQPRDRQTLLYVAPLIQQHDLVGFCHFILNYTCDNVKDKIDVKIPFDTRVGRKYSKMLMGQYVRNEKATSCSTIDEDSLKECEPVDCNMKYLDKRPAFDQNINKCVEVPICLTNLDKQLPDYVYIPDSNICRNLELPLTVKDIYAISSGLGTVTMPSDLTFHEKVEVTSNCSTISQNLNLIHDLMCGKLCPIASGMTLDYSECFKSALLTIAICVVSACSVMLFLVCLINTAVWIYTQWSKENFRKMLKSLKIAVDKIKFNKSKKEKVNSTIRATLLREVVIKDIPLELRNSVIDVCDRIGREVENKRRYRIADVGSQISLKQGDSFILSKPPSNS